MLRSLSGLTLDVGQFVLNHPAEIHGGTAELRQGAPQGAGEFRKLLRAKNHEGNEQDDDPVGNSEQFYSLPCLLRIEVTGVRIWPAPPKPYDILFGRR